MLANQGARTTELQKTKQMYHNKAFAFSRNFGKEQEHGEEATHSEMQVVLPSVLDRSPYSATNPFLGSLLGDDSKKRGKCETRNGAERLCNVFMKLSDALSATDAESFYRNLVYVKGYLKYFITSYSSINYLRVLPGE